jgi:hypothetical protein
MLSYVEFWIGTSPDQRPPANGSGVMFSASSRIAVDDFRAAPSANEAMSYEAPGVHLDSAPEFNAAYARDPGGIAASQGL